MSLVPAPEPPNPGHAGYWIQINVGGSEMSLQDAIYSGSLKNLPTSTSIIDPNIRGHSADTTWVSVDGSEKTLQQALSIPSGLCGSSSNPYSGNLNGGHLASEVKIEISTSGPEMTFQDAIDSGQFCP